MEIKKSTRKTKKYMVQTPNKKWVHFGDVNYEQYKDSTGLGLYSHLDHKDTVRRDRYRARHMKIQLKSGELAYKDPEQAAYYSLKYLW